MLYFSSGSVSGALSRGACPEAMGTKSRENKEVKTPTFDILKRTIIRDSLCERLPLTGKPQPSIYGIEWPLLVCTDCRSGGSTTPLRLISSRKLLAVTG